MCEHTNFSICTCVILSAIIISRHHYHSLENSRTFQDLALKFPGLSTGPNPFSRTFQDLEIVHPKIQDFPGAWEPCFSARSKICSYNVLMAEHKCDNMAYNSNLPSYPAKNCHLITQQKKQMFRNKYNWTDRLVARLSAFHQSLWTTVCHWRLVSIATGISTY